MDNNFSNTNQPQDENTNNNEKQPASDNTANTSGNQPVFNQYNTQNGYQNNSYRNNNAYHNQNGGYGEQGYNYNNNNRYPYSNIPSGNASVPKKPKKPHPFAVKLGKTAAIAAVFGIVAGSLFYGINSIAIKNGKSAINQDTAFVNTVDYSGKVSTIYDVSEIVNNAMPAMVAIDITATQTVQNPFSFFGFGSAYQQEVSGSGTGIIISKTNTSLFIATNCHVISGANQITVTFCNNSSVKAIIKGSDEESDLAVVEVKLTDIEDDTLNAIKVAVLGDSDKLQLGEPAIAIGNALGYGQSVTCGHISALAKEVQLTDKTMKLIQTDAAINPGNSGGALINSSGEVIGINSVKYASTEVEGIGYAIPITDAQPIISALMNGTDLPESEKPYLGISGTDVTEQYQERFGLPEGVYVTEVTAKSPAAEAGMKAYDIINSFDGKEIKSMNELTQALNGKKAGDTVTVTVMRHNNNAHTEVTLTVTLGSVSNAPKSSNNNSSSGANQYGYGFGN